MATVEVVHRSSVKTPRIQIQMSLREAELLTKDHKNIQDVLASDIKKAVEFANKQ